MGLVSLAVSDAAITFLWVIYIAFMRPATMVIASFFDLKGYEFPITVGLLAVNIFLFGWLGPRMGGAMWNPTPVLAFYSMGKSNDSLFSLAVRLPAQAVGAVGGVVAAKELIPPSYSHLLRGPQLMVDIYKGILAEFVLTAIIIFAVLVAVLKGPRSGFMKNCLILLATVAVVLPGSGYTGPAMNPAHAFAWAYTNDRHYSLEHLLVYWLAPLTGSLVASWVFQRIFSRDRPKEKSA